jgi:hypothetical protein
MYIYMYIYMYINIYIHTVGGIWHQGERIYIESSYWQRCSMVIKVYEFVMNLIYVYIYIYIYIYICIYIHIYI